MKRASSSDPLALSSIVRTYQPALLEHIRARFRLSPADAEDIVSDFFADKILNPSFMERAKQHRGRFRFLVKTSLERYAIDWLRRADNHSLAVSPGRLAQLDQNTIKNEATEENVDSFDRIWAETVVSICLKCTEAHFADTKQAHYWRFFLDRYINPLRTGRPPGPYEDSIRKFGFATVAAASNALVTVKRVLRRVLREVVSRYETDQPEEEVNHLKVIMENSADAVLARVLKIIESEM